MSLDQVLFELTTHYRSRGFPDSALSHLRWTLLSNVESGRFCLETPYAGCNKSIGELLGLFRPVQLRTLSEVGPAPTALFGFAFGYQMAEWVPGTHPTETLEVRLRRRPGKNNMALAAIVARTYANHPLPLYLQFEIADAMPTSIPVAYSSSRVDQSTANVVKEFLDAAAKQNTSINSVLLLAHQHHYERCRIILERNGVQSVPIPDSYADYDDNEAQPRTMSPEEYIVNDFASMAGMLGPK